MVRSNGLFPSFSTPLFQNEAKCKAIDNNNNNNNSNDKPLLYIIYIFFLTLDKLQMALGQTKFQKNNQKTMIREFENKLTKELL